MYPEGNAKIHVAGDESGPDRAFWEKNAVFRSLDGAAEDYDMRINWRGTVMQSTSIFTIYITITTSKPPTLPAICNSRPRFVN